VLRSGQKAVVYWIAIPWRVTVRSTSFHCAASREATEVMIRHPPTSGRGDKFRADMFTYGAPPCWWEKIRVCLLDGPHRIFARMWVIDIFTLAKQLKPALPWSMVPCTHAIQMCWNTGTHQLPRSYYILVEGDSYINSIVEVDFKNIPILLQALLLLRSLLLISRWLEFIPTDIYQELQPLICACACITAGHTPLPLRIFLVKLTVGKRFTAEIWGGLEPDVHCGGRFASCNSSFAPRLAQENQLVERINCSLLIPLCPNSTLPWDYETGGMHHATAGHPKLWVWSRCWVVAVIWAACTCSVRAPLVQRLLPF